MSDELSIDDELNQMRSGAARFLERCYFRSAMQRNAESARFAKGHQKLIGFVYARFHQMDQAQYVLDPRQMRECAIELIPLLEDEERARAFQSDFDQSQYEHTKAWMTACLYENLAEATGHIEGFNSDGMHQCIADGLQVCRRTGKLACVQCFREYATDVYTAADDFTMARHQCQTVLAHTGSWSDRGDRRWFVSAKMAYLSLLDGQPKAAVQAGLEALRLTEEADVALKLESKLRAMVELDTAQILAGDGRVDWSHPHADADSDWLPPDGEWPALELKRQLNDALQMCVDGQYPSAVDVLTEWDRRLDQQRCATAWFDVRLRLMSAMRLAGQTDRLERLGSQLQKRANDAGDFLTLRRLARLLDLSVQPTPLATLHDMESGPFSQAVSVPVSSPQQENQPPQESTTSSTPSSTDDTIESEYEDQILKTVQRLTTAESAEEHDAVIGEYLKLTADRITARRDASLLLHFARMFADETERGEEIWNWAQEILRKFSDSAGVHSLTAALGNVLRSSDNEEMERLIDVNELEKHFRLAMSLDPENVGAHLLAGEHFLFAQNHGEAERCLARAFRLDRTNDSAALQLSELYLQTDRRRDSLNVLDLCLREGSESANVAWDALVQAVDSQQFEAALTYADRFDELQPEESGVNYYRAVALLELGRFDQALQHTAAEAAFEPEETLHLDAVRACALLSSQQNQEATEQLVRIVEQPFGHLTFLTQNGIEQILDMIWRHVADSGIDHLQQRWHDRLLQLGQLPDSVFDQIRQQQEQRNVNFYQVLLEQTVGAKWGDSLSAMPGQSHWPSYQIVWGVLASNEDQAGELAKSFQAGCETEEPEILDIALDGEGYKDRIGVVWQGLRWSDLGDSEE